ncbi:MAG: sulfotransferase domain-containing protein [Nocardioides sp.]
MSSLARFAPTRLKDSSPRWVKDVANVGTRGYGVATTSLRPVPDFLVIGAKRGGTTSLFNYLMMHPGVLGLFPQSRGKKSTDYFFAGNTRSLTWYRSHFHTLLYRARLRRRLGYRPVGGEASPYYVWDPRIAGRVRAVAPEVKAIMLIRDPVERAWSHYLERQENGVEPLSFGDALAAEPDRTDGELSRMLADPAYHSTAHDWYTYRARGHYLPQIQNWLKSFDAEQLLVVRSEDLYADVQGVFDEVCRFLGVDRFALPTTKTFNASYVKSMVPDPQRGELAAHFAGPNAELEEFVGRSLDWTTPERL